MAAVLHLEFSKFGILDLYLNMIMFLLTAFRVNRAINRRDIAK